MDCINKQLVEKFYNRHESVILDLNTAIAYELSILLVKTPVTHLPHTIEDISKCAFIYCVGAKAGIALKSLRKQYYYLDGVSRQSVVRRYSNKYLTNMEDFPHRQNK